MGIAAIIFFLVALSVLLFRRFSHILTIRARTVHMRAPVNSERTPLLKNSANERVTGWENELRRKAYKDTVIKTGEAFYDDSDMLSDYYLVVIYDRKSKTPLLSSRYYFDKQVIENYLRGDFGSDLPVNLKEYPTGKIFLADRLSGNTSSAIYRHSHNYIFSLFYIEIFRRNKDCSFILMARSERGEKLLEKYRNIGLHVTGSTILRGKKHWILLGNLKYIYAQKRNSLIRNAFLLAKLSFYKLAAK